MSRPYVTAIVVAHDGARWLGETLRALMNQSRRPDRVVGVDNGSRDGSADLLAQALGRGSLISLPRTTGFGESVAEVLATVPPAADDEWIWLLHDDCAPDRRALEALLSAAEHDPKVAVLGPKLRDWLDRRRLLEIGVTVGRTGRRDTGLEPGEFDQGQHDGAREVLSVSTAGMLIRRDVWEQVGGLDPFFPLFRDDLDLCWRVRNAGHKVLNVTSAVAWHAEAAARRRRRIAVSGDHPRRLDRRNAIFVVMANMPFPAMVWALLRNVVGSIVRTLLFIVSKHPANALDEVVALCSILVHPFRLMSARRARRPGRKKGYILIKRLMTPRGAAYRRLTDMVQSFLAGEAPVDSAGRHHHQSNPGEDQELTPPPDHGAFQRFIGRPGVILMFALAIVSLIAERSLLGGERLGGGALVPVIGSAGDLWSFYAEGYHDVGLGSTAWAPPYVAVLAALSTITLGKTWVAVSALLLGSVPLAGATAYLATRHIIPAVPARAWAAGTYALLPVATGAIATGRLGTAVVFVLVPVYAWLCTRLIFGEPRQARRAAWGLGLVLTVGTAFAPIVYPLFAVVGVLGSVLFGRVVRRARAGTLGGPDTALAAGQGAGRGAGQGAGQGVGRGAGRGKARRGRGKRARGGDARGQVLAGDSGVQAAHGEGGAQGQAVLAEGGGPGQGVLGEGAVSGHGVFGGGGGPEQGLFGGGNAPEQSLFGGSGAPGQSFFGGGGAQGQGAVAGGGEQGRGAVSGDGDQGWDAFGSQGAASSGGGVFGAGVQTGGNAAGSVSAVIDSTGGGLVGGGSFGGDLFGSSPVERGPVERGPVSGGSVGGGSFGRGPFGSGHGPGGSGAREVRGGTALSLIIALAVPPVLLLPWLVEFVTNPGRLLLEAGLQDPALVDPSLAPEALLALSLGGAGLPPFWVTAGLLVAALAALLLRRQRMIVAVGWGIALYGMLASILVSRITVEGAQVWPGVPLAFAGAGLVVLVGLTAHRLAELRAGGGLRRLGALAVAAVAFSTPLLAAGYWMVDGVRGPLQGNAPDAMPALAASLTQQGERTLVIRGSQFTVLNGRTPLIGEAELPTASEDRRRLGAATEGLVGGRGGDAATLAQEGIAMVALAPPVSFDMARVLDSQPSLERLSLSNAGGLWRVAESVTPVPAQPVSVLHTPLLWIQAALVLAVALLASPGRRAPEGVEPAAGMALASAP